MAKSPRSLEDTRQELDRLAADLRALADQADRGVHSLDVIADAEAAAERWAPIAISVGVAGLVIYALTRSTR
ncbi:MAG: hypothetical protein AAFP84_09020 [Actinomycetota bacterium]